MWMPPGGHSLAKLVRSARKVHIDENRCLNPDITRVETDRQRDDRILQFKRSLASGIP